MATQGFGALFDQLKNIQTENTKAFQGLQNYFGSPKKKSTTYPAGPMSVEPQMSKEPQIKIPRVIPPPEVYGAEDAVQRAKQRLIGRKSAKTTTKFTPSRSTPEATRPAFSSGTSYADIVRQLGVPVSAASGGVSPASDTGRMRRTERNLALEQENLRKLLQTPGQLGVQPGADVTALPPEKQQLLREAINMATYGTPSPIFPGDVTATTSAAPEETPGVTGSEGVATTPDTGNVTGSVETDTGVGTEPFTYERERVDYESFYPDFERLSMRLLEQQLSNINRSHDARIAKQQEKDAETIAQSRAFFGAAGGNRYGMTPNELQYVDRLNQKAERNVREMEAARQADLLNATLGIQSNLLQAKIDDIEKQRQTDMFNINSGVQQATAHANIQKTLVDIQRIKTDMAGIERDEAQQIINDAFQNLGGGAFSDLDEGELSELSQKAGYPSNFLSNATRLVQEASVDELDWKFTPDENGNMTAYAYDPSIGDFVMKDLGKIGAAKKWTQVSSSRVSSEDRLASMFGQDAIDAAFRDYEETTGKLPPSNKTQRLDIVNRFLSSPKGQYYSGALMGPLTEGGFESPFNVFNEPDLGPYISDLEANGYSYDAVRQEILAAGGKPSDYGYGQPVGF